MLNRYEFDLNTGNMVKNNQYFSFQEKLDLESILSKATRDKRPLSQSCSTDGILNQYHLHSILVHQGTIDHGHYYAFIRPGVDDRWFQFNDSTVSEVTQAFAIA